MGPTLLQRQIRILVITEPSDRRSDAWWDVLDIVDENTGDSLVGDVGIHEIYAANPSALGDVEAVLVALLDYQEFAPKMFYDVKVRVMGWGAEIGCASSYFRGRPNIEQQDGA